MNAIIDHTALKANTTEAAVRQLCVEAIQYSFASVCTNGCWTRMVAELLQGTGVKTCAVVGFPLGAMATAAKAAETRVAIQDGAQEVDMVLNVGYALQGSWGRVEDDIRAVWDECKKTATILKVILETCLLTDEAIEEACRVCATIGVSFVKTSTGFSIHGATVEHVRLMRAAVGSACRIKASGGIRSRKDAQSMLDAGADRLGCSASVSICTSDT